ncbi:MAG: sugar phosphate isomerase/epimerase family protein [bacterium]|jgi:sugar phosphate isomerase/epimerase
MRLAVITDEVSEDFETVAKWMNENGVEGAELRGLWGDNVTKIDADARKRCKRIAKDYNLTICGIASPFYKCNFEGEGGPTGPLHLAAQTPLDEQLKLLAHCLEIANEFETPFVRVFSFWRTEKLTDTLVTKIAEALAEPIKMAERAGVTLILENEYSCMLGSGEETARVFKMIDSPYIKVCWDPGNAFCAGETPFPNGYNAIKPYLAHVHIKDAVSSGGEDNFVIVGEGQIDYAGQFKALKADGYNGFLSLETHARIEGLTSDEISHRCILGIRKLLEA